MRCPSGSQQGRFGSQRGGFGGSQQGVALIVALFTMLLLSALGIALMFVTMSETRIAGSYRGASEALHAADAAIEYAMRDLATVGDWNLALSGAVTSTFVDGPAGDRDTATGRINLIDATQMIRCRTATLCSDEDMDAVSEDRPWGLNNPRWHLYAHGRISEMAGADPTSSGIYAIVWVADDPGECDNKPLVDAGPPMAPCTVNRGSGVVVLLAHAYGPGGVRRAIEATVARGGRAGARMVSWREIR